MKFGEFGADHGQMIRGYVTRLGARTDGTFQCWTAIFVFVSLQMMTAIRPIVGRADNLLPTEKKFFFQYWGETILAAQKAARPSGEQKSIERD